MEGEEEAQKATLVESFCAVTASTPEEARFFLESHGWLLDSAVHSFYDDDAAAAAAHREDALAEEEDDLPAHPVAPPASILPPSLPAGPAAGSRRDKKPSGSGGGGGRSTIRTLADLNDSESDDSDGPQEYYTGGEKSGMLVQDPSKGGHDVDAIFDHARQMGASDGPLERHTSSSSRSFVGTGRLLSGETVQSAPQQPENVTYNINFWTNGFSINDGPLRRFDDPANASFLESIMKSECPKELEPADRRTAVSVSLVKKQENYPETIKRHTAFKGVGRTLGSGSSTPAASEPPATVATPSTVSAPSSGLTVDASLPSTSIQVRLMDGTRMVARFNTHHTVGDIRAFIDASRPGAARTYQLQTVGFPSKQLTDLSQTIEQAGLINSVVIQKL